MRRKLFYAKLLCVMFVVVSGIAHPQQTNSAAALKQYVACISVFDVEQVKQFITALSGNKYEALFALAITTGMRPSDLVDEPGVAE
jgi:hypothetical protein